MLEASGSLLGCVHVTRLPQLRVPLNTLVMSSTFIKGKPRGETRRGLTCTLMGPVPIAPGVRESGIISHASTHVHILRQDVRSRQARRSF